MSLNIKNPEAHKLAHDLAALTGESMSTAVTTAVRERLERLRRESDKDKFLANMMEIARDCARHLKSSPLLDNPDEFLYDENGLPK